MVSLGKIVSTLTIRKLTDADLHQCQLPPNLIAAARVIILPGSGGAGAVPGAPAGGALSYSGGRSRAGGKDYALDGANSDDCRLGWRWRACA